jgi:hypothetical protein
MYFKLGGYDSSDHFKFKIGDKVRSKLGATNGVVVSGDFYGPTRVLYVVQFKSPNVMKCTYMQDEIELLPEQ